MARIDKSCSRLLLVIAESIGKRIASASSEEVRAELRSAHDQTRAVAEKAKSGEEITDSQAATAYELINKAINSFAETFAEGFVAKIEAKHLDNGMPQPRYIVIDVEDAVGYLGHYKEHILNNDIEYTVDKFCEKLNGEFGKRKGIYWICNYYEVKE